MDSKNWQKIKILFNQAVDLPIPEREKFLLEQKEAGDDLLDEVRWLLEAEKANQFENPIASLANLWSESDNDDVSGREIANYKIIGEIGRGGMGIVYEALRETAEFSQKVALKLLKKGMDSEALIRRFRHERQILASLEHPNIARLLDGGVSSDGSSYLAMEFVEGLPLDEYCAAKDLSVTERLRLFLQICQAISFAHSRLVVHRDLKPSNIFVTKSGTVKLLDFGIAKIISSGEDLANQTVTTLGMMTPAYASPEQIRGEIVSTASDIYSLGLLLYELLTGAPAYVFPSNRPDDIAVVICESEPLRPSAAVSISFDKNKNLDETAQQNTNSKSKTQNPKALRGDLDNIILRALRKDPSRRYASVEQFAGDILRHLDGLPVIARPDTFSYRFEKFVSRHRISVIAGLLIAFNLITGISVAVWQAVRAERERALAEQQRNLAEKRFNQVRTLAHNVIFSYHDEIKDLPGATKAREIMVRDALKYLDNLQAETSDNPDLTRELAQSYLRIANVQGGSYQANLGDSVGAAESFGKAINLLKPLAEKSNDPAVLAELRDVYIDSGRVFFRSGKVDEQSANLQDAIKLSERLVKLAPENIDFKIAHARTLINYADTLGTDIERKNDYARKIEIFIRSRKIIDECLNTEPNNVTALRTAASATHRLYLHTLLLAEEAKKAGQFELEKNLWLECLGYAKSATEIVTKVLKTNPENPTYRRNTQASKINEGKIYRELGDTETAIRFARQALQAQLTIAEKDPQNNEIKLDIKESYEDLSLAYIKRGDLANAFDNFHKCVYYTEELLKKDPQNFEFWIAKLRGQQVFADALLARGEKKMARGIYEKVIVTSERETPEQYIEFVKKFRNEITESLEKCSL